MVYGHRTEPYKPGKVERFLINRAGDMWLRMLPIKEGGTTEESAIRDPDRRYLTFCRDDDYNIGEDYFYLYRRLWADDGIGEMVREGHIYDFYYSECGQFLCLELIADGKVLAKHERIKEPFKLPEKGYFD